jgi:NitT/TauT family transport system permease protein
MTRRLWISFAQLVTVIIALSAWQWVGSDKNLTLFISTPGAVAHQLVSWSAEPAKWAAAGATLGEAALGFLIAVVSAVLLGSLVGGSASLARFFDPFITAANAVPKLAMAPLFIMIFGIGLVSKVYFVSTAVFFIPFYNIFAGFRAMDPVFVQNVRILGAGWGWRVRDVYAPALFGTLIASLRVTASWSVLAAVIAECIAASSGIGLIISQGQAELQNDVVLAGVVVVSTMVFIIDRSLVLIERRFASWRLA